MAYGIGMDPATAGRCKRIQRGREVQRSVERSQSEQAWSTKNEQRGTIMYHSGIVEDVIT